MKEDILREALFKNRETLVGLARRLTIPVTTLGSWARNTHPCPAVQLKRIEKALRLPAGSLTTTSRGRG